MSVRRLCPFESHSATNILVKSLAANSDSFTGFIARRHTGADHRVLGHVRERRLQTCNVLACKKTTTTQT